MRDCPPLHNYSGSRAVLVGTWDYKNLPKVSAAKHSLNRMRALLAGDLCGWPSDRITVIRNQQQPGEMPDRLVELFADTDRNGIALFYYVGHGQPDSRDRLCLGLVDSLTDAARRATTSLRFEDVREALHSCHAGTKLVILDCCFAGLATHPHTLSPSTVEHMIRVDGACTIAAVGAYNTAWFEADDTGPTPQTFFTKYLADVIEQGIPGEPPVLDLDGVFSEVRYRLVTDEKPEPTRIVRHAAGRFIFAHNASPAKTYRQATEPDMQEQFVIGRFPHAEIALNPRPDLMGLLQEKVTRGTKTPVVHAVVGMGGVGKTQLAAAYARERAADGWPTVVWINASTQDEIRAGFAAVAAKAEGLSGNFDIKEAAARGLQVLRERPGPHLVVYDDAKEVDQVTQWMQSVGSIQSVITSTDTSFERLGKPVRVGPFRTAEALSYLRERTGLTDKTGGKRLVEALGGLPLALTQACGVIGPGRQYGSYDNYLPQLSKVPLTDLLVRLPGDPYPDSTAQAILLSLQHLSTTDTGDQARHLLDLLSVLSRSGVSMSILEGSPAGDKAATQLYDAAIGQLESRSLAQRSTDRTSLRAHPIVQQVVREALQANTRFHDVAAAATTLLSDVIARTNEALLEFMKISYDEMTSSDRPPGTRDIWSRETTETLRIAELAGHVETLWGHSLANRDSLDSATVSALLGVRVQTVRAFSDSLNTGRARAMGGGVVTDCENRLGESHEITVSARQHLAEAYIAGGDADGLGLSLLRENVRITHDVLGAEHPLTIAASHELADAQGHLNGLGPKMHESWRDWFKEKDWGY